MYTQKCAYVTALDMLKTTSGCVRVCARAHTHTRLRCPRITIGLNFARSLRRWTQHVTGALDFDATPFGTQQARKGRSETAELNDVL
jgi:hypothetical protein